MSQGGCPHLNPLIRAEILLKARRHEKHLANTGHSRNIPDRNVLIETSRKVKHLSHYGYP
jgi:hypothetical protein